TAGLAGGAETAAVIGDHAVSGIQQRGDLLLPRVAVQRETMNQDDGSARAEVLVVEVDAAGVLLSDLDVGHGGPLPVIRLLFTDLPPLVEATPGTPRPSRLLGPDARRR